MIINPTIDEIAQELEKVESKDANIKIERRINTSINFLDVNITNEIPRPHGGIFTMIKQIPKEQNEVEMEIEQSMRGEPAPKKRKEDENREARIQNVIADRGNRSTIDFLRGIAYNLSL
ncbi:unnamed protein product [Rotaria sp. Silwood2]|nr:unnamed protein product [Rotaria sp. Silwood2]CAF4472398.1 unnamed protein product [Rotaria sp. Silwood2]